MTDAAAAPPRIIWLTTEFFPPETGGTGILAARLTQGLAARGLGVQVATRQTMPHCPADDLVGQVRVRRINPAGRLKGKGAGWRAFPAMLGFVSRLAVLLIARRRDYDVVVVSGMKTIPITAVPVCRMLGKRCVVRIESPFELVEPISAESLNLMNGIAGRFASGVLKRMQLAVIRGADCVIAISEDIAGRLSCLEHPPARIARIPNAVDMTKFKPASAEHKRQLRGRFGFAPDRTIVLYVGRLSRAKGVMMLIKAWPRIIERYPGAHLVMVGSGQGSWDDCEADIVDYMRRHALESRIALVGHSDSVHDYLQAADLFVSPSDYEGFSLTVVEALGCGIPVVATSVGVAPEAIRDGVNGFLCEPKNEASLSRALDAALGQPERWADIGRLAREAAETFDIPRIVDKYVALLEDLRL